MNIIFFLLAVEFSTIPDNLRYVAIRLSDERGGKGYWLPPQKGKTNDSIESGKRTLNTLTEHKFSHQCVKQALC